MTGLGHYFVPVRLRSFMFSHVAIMKSVLPLSAQMKRLDIVVVSILDETCSFPMIDCVARERIECYLRFR